MSVDCLLKAGSAMRSLRLLRAMQLGLENPEGWKETAQILWVNCSAASLSWGKKFPLISD